MMTLCNFHTRESERAGLARIKDGPHRIRLLRGMGESHGRLLQTGRSWAKDANQIDINMLHDRRGWAGTQDIHMYNN